VVTLPKSSDAARLRSGLRTAPIDRLGSTNGHSGLSAQCPDCPRNQTLSINEYRAAARFVASSARFDGLHIVDAAAIPL
jgi:hypothetical protein